MYLCPVCKAPLAQKSGGLGCEQGHSFDRSRKGYVNLLLSHRMKSRQPGDSKEMIEARSAFLSAGYYRPLVEALAAVCQRYDVGHLLDAGCGEGYYASELARRGVNVAGTDISKAGIVAACRRDKNPAWCIASISDLPYETGYFDAVLSVFSLVDEAQFIRVLKPGGIVIFVGPGEDHLPALRAGLYESVRPYKSDKPDRYFTRLQDIERQTLRFPLALEERSAIEQLLKMTPHYWNTNLTQHERLFAQAPLTDTADMQIRVYRRDADPVTPSDLSL